MNADDILLLRHKADAIASSWADINADDLNNELVMLWLEDVRKNETNPNHVGIISYKERDAEKQLHKMLNRWAYAYCRKETAAIRGHDDYAEYTRNSIKLLLPLINDPDQWGSLTATGTPGRSSRPANEGGDVLATYADLKGAWDKLNKDQRVLLTARYVNEDPGVFADWEHGDAARKRCSRALDKLVMLLAGPSKASGPRRRAQTNAAAHSQLSRDY